MIINIEEIKIETIMGVYAWEQEKPRILYVDIAIDLDASRAIKSDNITDTVDYDEIVKTIHEVAASRQFNLLETMADAMVTSLKALNGQINHVSLKIHKPGAVKDAKVSVSL